MQTDSVPHDPDASAGPRYLVEGLRLAASDPGLQAHLAQVYGRDGAARPRCLCTADGCEMYVVRIAGVFHLKRMPGQGARHDWRCPSSEPPAQLSGLGQVLGAAVDDDPATGATTLKLGFSLSRVSRRPPAADSEGSATTATSSGSRLTLRGLLHLLWEDAGFNSWTPAMAGKRNWAVIRTHILAAARRKQSRGVALSESLYLPEPWEEARRDAIAQRRRETFLRVASAPKGPRRLLLLLGEVRRLEPGRYGHRLIVRHAPDVDFTIDDDLERALRRRFVTELSAWEAAEAARDHSVRLMVMGTFNVGLSGRPALEEVVLMTTTANWIPMEDAFDAEVIARLSASGRRFTRCLRYNLPASAPIACATGAEARGPVAYCIVRPAAAEDYEARLQRLIDETGVLSWTWRPAEGPPPSLDQTERPGPAAPKVAAPAFDPFGSGAGH